MKTLIASVLLVLASIALARSAETAAQTNKPPMKVPQGMPFYGKVASVDKQLQILTLDGKEKTRLFYLTPATRIHRDKRPAKIDEVIVGQWVGGFVRPDAEGRPTVVSLNLAVEQRGPPPKATNAVPRKAAPAK
jgi:hypothetical protein